MYEKNEYTEVRTYREKKVKKLLKNSYKIKI